MSYLQQKVELDRDRWAILQPWVSTMLLDNPVFLSKNFPLQAAELEGVLPWLAFELHDAGLLDQLGDQQKEVRKVLAHCAAAHLYCEWELARLALLADDLGVDFLAIKGHAVARTLYKHTACRPTSDFDILIAPKQIKPAAVWLTSAGYKPYGSYYGIHWLASQVWVPSKQRQIPVTVDLHWDVSNRMYFRHRFDIDELVCNARRVQVGKASIRVPNLFDDTIIACVHLAAMDPGMPVGMRWMLDIRLLMASIPHSQVDEFVTRAAELRTVEACLVFGEAAAGLDESEALVPVLDGLRAVAASKLMAKYDRTLRSRGYDLWDYWWRLKGRKKLGFYGDLMRKLSARSNPPNTS